MFIVISDNYDDELQMAANDITDVVIAQTPESFKNFDSEIKSLSSSQENAVNYDVDMNDELDAEEYQVDWDTLFGAVQS